MRYVIYEGKDGFIRRAAVRDSDSDSMAAFGIPAGPPEVSALDIDAILRQVNRILVEKGAFDLEGLMRSGALNDVASIFRRALYDLYLQERNQH